MKTVIGGEANAYGCPAAEAEDGGEKQRWVARAALYELISMGLSLPTKNLAVLLSNGEYLDALLEASHLCGVGVDLEARKNDFAAYEGADAEALFHKLRTEYTRLFATPKHVLVSPYAGIWYANKSGVQPVLFVNKESMGVERFMKKCGIVRAEGAYEPLDHIGTEFEFLNYLCLQRAGSVEFPDGVHGMENAYEEFYSEHISNWVSDFARALSGQTQEPLYEVLSIVVETLPRDAL